MESGEQLHGNVAQTDGGDKMADVRRSTASFTSAPQWLTGDDIELHSSRRLINANKPDSEGGFVMQKETDWWPSHNNDQLIGYI